MEVLAGHVGAYVLRGGDGLAWGIGDGLAADVRSGKISGSGYGFRPGEKVARLLGEEAAPLFLIEEEDGAGGEVFALSGGYGSGSVFLA
jgi:hypothetical protein